MKVMISAAGADLITQLQDLEESNSKIIIDPADIGDSAGISLKALSQDEARELRKELASIASQPVPPAPFDKASADEMSAPSSPPTTPDTPPSDTGPSQG